MFKDSTIWQVIFYQQCASLKSKSSYTYHGQIEDATYWSHLLALLDEQFSILLPSNIPLGDDDADALLPPAADAVGLVAIPDSRSRCQH